MKIELPKKYSKYPREISRPTLWRKIKLALQGGILAPLYWFLAYATKTPGLRFRKYFALMGLRFLFRKWDFQNAYRLIMMPMDSLRYFEFEFMWGSARKLDMRTCLDVSSPRLFPLMLADRLPNVSVDLINPDKRDLTETTVMAQVMGLGDRCRFHPKLIGDVDLVPGSYDLVTSMSVIEHITDDKAAITMMWELLKPGGRLLITVPCATTAYEEYINQNDYELSELGDDGFIFFQRFYDEILLEERVFSITGRPVRFQIYGEKDAGSYEKNEYEKRTNPNFPFWRAPLDMGLKYEYKRNLSDLSGIGVIAFEFLKR